MTVQRNDIINIPLEFKLACLVEGFSEQAVLQAFIDHISFYAVLGSGYIKGYREATSALKELNFTNSKGQASEAFANNREIASQCTIEILKIGIQTGNAKAKKNRSRKYIKKLFDTMERTYSTDKLYLAEESVLVFNEDFQVLCEFFNRYPKEYLEYFMSKIDLADHLARIGLNKLIVNGSMAFFAMLMGGFIKDNIRNLAKPATELQIEFIDELQQLHAKNFIVRNVEKRRVIYHNFFYNYYNKTNF
ncbi:MAG: hypothetical protein V4456_14210 [Bacteroidota bacterium]|jgi:hypothetical protein|uniref:hypothetical protein n=1 Tax=Mucilaginibacter inviolabilis TaxID=2714892 RepID=UPI00140903E4|nr:hypothetical protein [Mucilaginibacter inviolabilis]NHA05833.1 hypothetical protein [Mucilaginibacter inviolabilis]